MKNVLVISQYFAPMNIIASIRFTKMVKFLARTGEYHFWVICIKVNRNDIRDELLWKDIEGVKEHVTILPVSMDKKFIKEIKKIFAKENKQRVTFSNKVQQKPARDLYYAIQRNFVTCKQSGIFGGIKRTLGKMFLFGNDMYDLGYEKIFVEKGRGLFKQIPIDDIDVMISTYGQIGSLLLALKFKKIKNTVRWIVDYRDAVSAVSGVKQRYLKYIVEKADKQAEYITGATDSCCGSGNYLKKFHVITNGFDKEDISGFGERVGNKRLEIVYTGSLYGGRRDMSLLFKIISELERERKVSSDRIKILYAGSQFHILEDQARVYNLEKILVNKGNVPRKKALELQYQADILCVLSRSEEEYKNWLPGKMVECIMMEKNIFSIVTGTEGGSIVRNITDQASLGCCYEEANHLEDYAKAKQWFLDKYREFVQKGYIVCSSDKKKTEEFSSENLAAKFKCLIDA